LPRRDNSSENKNDGAGSGRSGGDGSDRRRELMRYAGLSSELAASIGIAVFIGVKADKWLKVSFPILSWCLPLLVIVVLIIKLIKEGSGKNNGK
jgi:hypothetical protein